MPCNTKFGTNVNKNGPKSPRWKWKCASSFDIWTNNKRLFANGKHFGYLFVFVVLVSIMEDYLSAEDHILLAQF